MSKRRTKPGWTRDGLPMNLEAAAADVLPWLELAREADLVKHLFGANGTRRCTQSEVDDNRARLGGAIDALAAALRGEFAREVKREPAVAVVLEGEVR
jgi:hypothetical protein